jgi:hypothetical protein
MHAIRRSAVPKIGRVAVIALALGVLFGGLAPAAFGRASVDRIAGPFVSVVPVAYADNPAGVELMFVECDFVQRVEKPDGTAVETQQCTLTEPFVEFPGTPPTEAFTNTAGECIWFSDYFLQATGEEVLAESVRLTVTPSGNVSVTTMYPSEPLDCS